LVLPAAVGAADDVEAVGQLGIGGGAEGLLQPLGLGFAQVNANHSSGCVSVPWMGSSSFYGIGQPHRVHVLERVRWLVRRHPSALLVFFALSAFSAVNSCLFCVLCVSVVHFFRPLLHKWP